jgi:hypothetical protein
MDARNSGHQRELLDIIALRASSDSAQLESEVTLVSAITIREFGMIVLFEGESRSSVLFRN